MSIHRSSRIALATCSTLPDWEVDDHPLFDLLLQKGIDLVHPCWDDPTFQWETCDLVIPRTTWDYQERAVLFQEWMDHVHQVSRLLNPCSMMKWNLKKTYLQDLKIAKPPTLWLSLESDHLDLGRYLNEQGWSRGFIKPVIGASSKGTCRFNQAEPQSIEQANQHLKKWVQTHTMLVQPYYASVETEGEFSLIFFNGHFSHGVKKVPVPGDYRVQDDYGAQDFPWVPSSWGEEGTGPRRLSRTR